MNRRREETRLPGLHCTGDELADALERAMLRDNPIANAFVETLERDSGLQRSRIAYDLRAGRYKPSLSSLVASGLSFEALRAIKHGMVTFRLGSGQEVEIGTWDLPGGLERISEHSKDELDVLCGLVEIVKEKAPGAVVWDWCLPVEQKEREA
jgi:hypothetical protein